MLKELPTRLGLLSEGPARLLGLPMCPEEWKKMSHVDTIMWEHAATEAEKDIKEGLEKSLKKAEKEAEKLQGKAKKSKDGKDAAAAKESAKDAKKLRRTVLKSVQKIDSANDRNIRYGHP